MPQLRLPKVDLDALTICPALVTLLPKFYCAEQEVLPVAITGRTAIIATTDESPERLVKIADAVQFLTGYSAEFVGADQAKLRALIDALLPETEIVCGGW